MHNVGTITEVKRVDAADYVKQHCVDICILMDTGIIIDQINEEKHKWTQWGKAYYIIVFPAEHGDTMMLASSFIAVIHKRISSRRINQLGQLGTLVEVEGVTNRLGCTAYTQLCRFYALIV